MKKLIPNIAVENCKEVLDYYKEVFGGEIKNLQITDGNEMFKDIEKGKVIHAELHVNADCIIYLNDNFGPKKESGNINIILIMDSIDEINSLYNKLKEKGNVSFELQKTFWGSYHAVITDCYGTTWSMDYS